MKTHDYFGQERYRATNEYYYKNGDCCLLVYDINEINSFQSCIDYYKDTIKKLCKKNVKVALCGNKTDVEDEREVPYEKALKFAQENNYFFMETSCLKMENVKNIFDTLIITTYYELKNNNKKKNFANDINIEKEINSKNLNKDIKKLESLNKKINDKLKNLENELNEEKNKNKKLKKIIEDMKKEIKEKEIIINKERKKYQDLNKKVKELEKICNKNTNLQKVLEIMENLKEKENEINELKNKLPFELTKEEKLISVNFISFNEEIIKSVICKNTHNFYTIKTMLYDKYPEFQKLNSQFFINGIKINENKNLKENNISDNSLIIIYFD